MALSNITFRIDHRGQGWVKIDGVKVPGVQSVSIDTAAGAAPVVVLRLIGKVEGEVVTDELRSASAGLPRVADEALGRFAADCRAVAKALGGFRAESSPPLP